MRIPRFYCDCSLSPEQDLVLDAELAHYMHNVLRLSPHQAIVLFNGDGNDYSAEILEISKRKVVVQVDAQISVSNESPLHIHLAQGVSKGDRMEVAIQKSVELGVTEITPVITERCAVKLDTARWEKKHQQWQKIVIAACEQSGRTILPKLHFATPLNKWISQGNEQSKLILSPKAEKYIDYLSPTSYGFRLLIGPEGGLSEQEVYTCEQLGFESVNMGPRVLRTETAALASIAILQSRFGDL